MGTSRLLGRYEEISYSCGHVCEVNGPNFPEGDPRYVKLLREWRERLEAMPCLACRIENVRSHGALEKMRVRAAKTSE
ncbi:MAG: hypothetical protein ACP5SH_26885 [Syntrophobacteraceae bacterium]